MLSEWNLENDSVTKENEEADGQVLRDLQTSFAVFALHVATVLKAQSLGAPQTCMQRAVQVLIAGLRVPQPESLRQSRLLRDQGWTVIQALVEALPYRSGE